MKQTTTLTLVETGAALDEIERRKAQLSAALAGVGLELERAEAELGERVLAGHEDAMRDVLELRTRADGLNAALAALEKRRAAALLDQKRATALDLRQQAAAKRVALAEIESATKTLLDKLSTLEDVRYTTSILSSQRQGAWFAFQGGLREPDEFLGAWESYADPTNRSPFAIPKSRLLRVETAELEGRAATIEAELGETRAEQARPEAAAPQPEPQQGASRWKEAPRREKDDSGFTPWPGGPAAGL